MFTKYLSSPQDPIIKEIKLSKKTPNNDKLGYEPLTAGALATNGPAPGIMGAGHNISPCLRKQLVLELEVGVEVTKVLERLPGSVLLGQAMPFDEHVPDIPPKLCTEGALWSWKELAIPCRRKRSRSCWRITFVGLKQPHMEDIM
jgi:hypothetical protein